MRLRSPVAGALLLACVFSACFYAATAFLLRRWRRPGAARSDTLLSPVTFFRPVKSGEPFFGKDFRAFLEALEPGDQVLVGATGGDEIRACKKLAREFPACDISCIPCAGAGHANPKVGKLVRLEEFAKHARWIILDSDTLADRDFLRAIRREWESSGATAISAPYSFVHSDGLPSRLDALATELALWPGVAWLRAADRVHFLLGACIGVRADAVRALGGWQSLGDTLAEDHELGRAIHANGGTLQLSQTWLRVRAGRMTYRDAVLHQHRAFTTFRLCNPSGSLGIPLTHGVAASAVLIFMNPRSSARWILHLALLLLRAGCARSLPGAARRTSDVLIVSLLEPLFWLASRLPLPVRWGGRWIHSKVGP